MSADDEYDDIFTAGLEWMWGAGFMSPGGAAEVAEIVRGVPVEGGVALDIGCGLAGVDIALVENHGLAHVTGIDVEAPLTLRARQNVSEAGLADRIDIRLVSPGRLPFDDDSFDLVFSKDSMVHIPDKRAIYQEIRRVLRPGGFLAFGDWFGSSAPGTLEMTRWLELVGLSFSLGTLGQCIDTLNALGFRDVTGRDRNDWYDAYMLEELASIEGERMQAFIEKVGEAAAERRRNSSRIKQVVVAQGQLRPAHVRAVNYKPVAAHAVSGDRILD